jgi:hypothetical protein
MIKTTAQLYWLPWGFYVYAEEDRPIKGGFIFDEEKEDKVDTVIGFIADVDDNGERVLMCLFEPMEKEFPDTIEMVSQKLPDSEPMDRLEKILRDNPRMLANWCSN